MIRKPVCFVTGFLGGTHGTSKSAHDFLRALLACHSSVQVISPTKGKYPETICGYHLSIPQWILFPVEKMIKKKSLRSWIDFCVYFLRKKQNQRELIKLIEDPNYVFINGWASYSYWKKIEQYFCCPKILIVRESPRHFAGMDRYIEIKKQISVLTEFDSFIFVSENTRKEWMSFPQLSQKAAFVLPNCCEEEEIAFQLKKNKSSERQRFGIKQDDFVIICPGTIEYRKGQDLLINIIPELSKKIANLKVLLVGAIGTDWGRSLLKQIEKKPAYKCVHFYNARPGIIDLLHISDLLAFPSRAEAMPRTILEAMAIKLPVICSGVDGVTELVEHRRTGLIFNSENSSKLIEYIMELYSKKEYRRILAQDAYDRYWERFSRRSQIERMFSIIKTFEC